MDKRSQWDMKAVLRFAMYVLRHDNAFTSVGEGSTWLRLYIVFGTSSRHICFQQDGRVYGKTLTDAASRDSQWLSAEDSAEWCRYLGIPRRSSKEERAPA